MLCVCGVIGNVITALCFDAFEVLTSALDTYNPVNCIPQHSELCLLGVTLQSDCKFSSHVKFKLAKANKGLHILRTLRKEQYDQNEIDLLFKTIVLPN